MVYLIMRQRGVEEMIGFGDVRLLEDAQRFCQARCDCKMRRGRAGIAEVLQRPAWPVALADAALALSHMSPSTARAPGGRVNRMATSSSGLAVCAG